MAFLLCDMPQMEKKQEEKSATRLLCRVLHSANFSCLHATLSVCVCVWQAEAAPAWPGLATRTSLSSSIRHNSWQTILLNNNNVAWAKSWHAVGPPEECHYESFAWLVLHNPTAAASPSHSPPLALCLCSSMITDRRQWQAPRT